MAFVILSLLFLKFSFKLSFELSSSLELSFWLTSQTHGLLPEPKIKKRDGT